jgi:hypothetical protein
MRAVHARLAQRQSTRVTGGRSDGQHVQRVPSAYGPKERTPDYESGSGGSSPPRRAQWSARSLTGRLGSLTARNAATLPWSRGEDASFRSWRGRFESSWEHPPLSASPRQPRVRASDPGFLASSLTPAVVDDALLESRGSACPARHGASSSAIAWQSGHDRYVAAKRSYRLLLLVSYRAIHCAIVDEHLTVHDVGNQF